MTIYCAASVDRAELRELTSVLQERFGGGPPPAITLVFVHALLRPDWLVEVQAVAALP